MSTLDLLIVGPCGGTHVGQSLYEAAQQSGLAAELLDTRPAYDAPAPWAKVSWHVLGHRPARLGHFGTQVARRCAAAQPRVLLSVGIAPVSDRAVRAVRALGVRTINFLTDDPWNASHRGRWVFAALREYDLIASPRRANLAQLAQLGRAEVRYVPFGYDPRHSFADPAEPALSSDVLFVGGADADRVPWIRALLVAGVEVAVYGGYWDRFDDTRRIARGLAEPAVIRRATSATKVALCLVRRANRDGHVMRSLEIAATGACMAVEDTDEHRALFGEDGAAVVYFRTPAQMVERVAWLLANEDERRRLARAVYERIGRGGHCYTDRLSAMLA